MTKIVVNRCFGGFGLSPEGCAKYLEKQGKKAYFYTQTKYKHRDGVEEYTRVAAPENKTSVSVTTKDFGPKTNEIYHNDGSYFSYYDLERDDSALVKTVEELGSKADGWAAQLEVVEIPDGVNWYIDDYDGRETVDEEHRSW